LGNVTINIYEDKINNQTAVATFTTNPNQCAPVFIASGTPLNNQAWSFNSFFGLPIAPQPILFTPPAICSS
jgi:hypothetical protein